MEPLQLLLTALALCLATYATFQWRKLSTVRKPRRIVIVTYVASKAIVAYCLSAAAASQVIHSTLKGHKGGFLLSRKDFKLEWVTLVHPFHK